jgi:purine-nucleoside phosphorylase
VVLGTGLGGFAQTLEPRLSLPFAELPGLSRATTTSHQGRCTLGLAPTPNGPVPLWCLEGRLHLYEGHAPAAVVLGVRLLAGLGVQTLILTNAAGALNPQFVAGTLMRITDQINCTGQSPLLGPNEDAWGPRFPDMSRVYDRELGRTADRLALELGLALERGVYAGVLGPSLETPAETRMLRTLGADAVGMSTVLEAIAARHMGLRLLGLSCLTNKNLPDCMAETSLEAVLATAREAEARLSLLLQALLGALADQKTA